MRLLNLKLWLLVSVLFIACKQQEHKGTAERGALTTATADTALPLLTPARERELIINGLRNMQSVFAAGDRQQIAHLFSFPMPAADLPVFPEDPDFRRSLEQQKGMITESLFLKSYDAFARGLAFDQMNELFNHLDTDSLLYTHVLAKTIIRADEPCKRSYQIEIEGAIVRLLTSKIPNEYYLPGPLQENKLPARSVELCGHAVYWKFRFDGRFLQLVRIIVAGSAA